MVEILKETGSSSLNIICVWIILIFVKLSNLRLCMCLIPIWLYCRLPLKINQWYLPLVEDILCKFRSSFLFLSSRSPHTAKAIYYIDEFHLYYSDAGSFYPIADETIRYIHTYIGKGVDIRRNAESISNTNIIYLTYGRIALTRI